MPTRHQVREAAIQLFYARASSQTAESDDELWSIINDRGGLAFDRARVKVLGHWQNGRRLVAAKLLKSLSGATAAIDAADPTGKAARLFTELSNAEIALAEFIENLVLLTKADTGGWREDLQRAFNRSAKVRKTRGELRVHFATFPPLQKQEIEKLFEKLETFDKRVEMTKNPGKFPDQRELAHLHKTLDEMLALRREAEKVTSQVGLHLKALNEAIGAAAENYDLDRLSRVDLSILRLGVWEILYAPQVPPAVAINEAINLARAYSGEEAASFVNGLLDRIAKDHAAVIPACAPEPKSTESDRG